MEPSTVLFSGYSRVRLVILNRAMMKNYQDGGWTVSYDYSCKQILTRAGHILYLSNYGNWLIDYSRGDNKSTHNEITSVDNRF